MLPKNNFFATLKKSGESGNLRNIFIEANGDRNLELLYLHIRFTLDIVDSQEHSAEEVLSLYSKALPEESDYITISVPQRIVEEATREARIRGVAKERIDTAKKLVDLGIDTEVIQNVTGFEDGQLEILSEGNFFRFDVENL